MRLKEYMYKKFMNVIKRIENIFIVSGPSSVIRFILDTWVVVPAILICVGAVLAFA